MSPVLKYFDETTQAWVALSGPPGPSAQTTSVPAGRIWAYSQTVIQSGVSDGVILDGESFLQGGMVHDTSGKGSLVVPVDGIYDVTASVGWQNNMNPIGATTNGFLSIWRLGSRGDTQVAQFFNDNKPSAWMQISGSDKVECLAGEQLCITAFQDTGAGQGTLFMEDRTFLAASLIPSEIGIGPQGPPGEGGGSSDGPPIGCLAYAQITTIIPVTSIMDIPGLEVEVTVPEGRTLKITGYSPSFGGGSVSDMYAMMLARVDTGESFALANLMGGVTNYGIGATVTGIVTPPAGTHGYKLQANHTLGSSPGNFEAYPQWPAWIMVEDITHTSGGFGGGEVEASPAYQARAYMADWAVPSNVWSFWPLGHIDYDPFNLWENLGTPQAGYRVPLSGWYEVSCSMELLSHPAPPIALSVGFDGSVSGPVTRSGEAWLTLMDTWAHVSAQVTDCVYLVEGELLQPGCWSNLGNWINGPNNKWINFAAVRYVGSESSGLIISSETAAPPNAMYFEEYQSVSQGLANATWAQLLFDAVATGTGWFDRGYQCPLAGRYRVMAAMTLDRNTVTSAGLHLRKNNTQVKMGEFSNVSGVPNPTILLSAQVICEANDLLTIWCQCSPAANTFVLFVPQSYNYAQFTYEGPT